jgi:hypothetical protein
MVGPASGGVRRRGRWKVPRKGRARRFREARELKQGYDDGLFREGSGTLADLEEQDEEEPDEAAADDDEWAAEDDWDEDDPLKIDEQRNYRAS